MTPTAQQSLQPLDIFQLLGYIGTDETEKSQILEEAQSLLLQDLVETDLVSKLSPEDLERAKQILAEEATPLSQRQTELLTFLHDKVNDLDQVLLEKTAQMKWDVMQERLNDMKAEFAQDAYSSQQLSQAELWMHRENFAEAIRIMNMVSARVPRV